LNGPTRARQAFTRYVAIGDSFTEGMSDADPERPDRYVGWADRLAAHLARLATEQGKEDQQSRQSQQDPDFGYANLAVRGRLLANIVGPQLEHAISLEPDLVSIVGGGNDILRPRADIDALAARLEDAVSRLRACGQGDKGTGRHLRGAHLVDRPAPRRLCHRPLGHGRAARLATVGSRPDPPDT